MKLEIKVLWCKGISSFNFFQKLTPYIAVSIHTIDDRFVLSESQRQEQKTNVDDDGDGNPEWHYTMHFNLDGVMMTNLGSYLLLFEIKNHGNILTERNIGDVKVPLVDLVGGVGVGVVRLASYEVRSFDGKSNGVLDFSYKVIGDHHVGNQSGPLDCHPRVEVDGYGGNGVVPSAPPLLENGGRFQGYPPPLYPPEMWGPPPPPPPRPQPVVYRPPPEEYYGHHQHHHHHAYNYIPPSSEEHYNHHHHHHPGGNGYSYSGHHEYSYGPPPPPPPAPATGEHYHHHQHSSSGGGYRYHHW